MKWLFYPAPGSQIEPSSVWIRDNLTPGYVRPYPEFAKTTPRIGDMDGLFWWEQVAYDYTRNGVRYHAAEPYRFEISGSLHGATLRPLKLEWKERTRAVHNSIDSQILAETVRQSTASVVLRVGDIVVWRSDAAPAGISSGGNVYAEELRVRVVG